MAAGAASARQVGVASGLLSYVLWGLFPLYWGYLAPATPAEVLAARVVFSLACLALLVSVVDQWCVVARLLRDPRRRLILAGAAVLVSVNWGTFIWAVDNDHVVDASLGYFINPLVSVALGVVVLRERLRPAQWMAVGIAGVAVLYATASLGGPPWVSLVLAGSFGLYGLAKKMAGVDAIPSLTVELILLTPFALAYFALLGSRDELALGTQGWTHTLLMVTAGPVTALPLLLFGAAAHRIPLSVLGPLQYVTPTLQLAIGVWLFAEPMSTERWLAFCGVWLALAVLTADALRGTRRGPRVSSPASAATIPRKADLIDDS